MITIFQRTIKDRKLKTTSKHGVGTWIYIENPTPEELDRASNEFKLERDLLEDALDPNEVPRVETEEGTTYVFARIPYEEKGVIFTSPILVGVAKNFVFTVSSKKLPFLEKFITGKIEFYTTQKSKLFTQIFSQVNGAYTAFLTSINRRVRSISVGVEQIKNRDIIQFVQFEGVLNDFLAALFPTNNLLKNLLSGKFFKLYEEDQDLVEDLFLTNGQLIESCQSNLRNIVNIREAYSTIMTQDLNRIIKLLTALTVVFTIPTMIASFYGMNVSLPLSENPLAFYWIAGTTAVISLILLVLFAYKRWL